MIRLTLFLLFALAGLFLANPVHNAYNLVYKDNLGIHYTNTPPHNITRRHENDNWGKPKPKPKPKGHQVGWPKPHDGHGHDHHKPINYHGHNFPYDPILEIIIEKKAEAFCSTFLHIIPYASTTTKVSTKTTSKVEATDTITSTSISNPGATTVTATASTTTTTSDVVATTTLTDVITSTSTSTTTTTTTSFQFTAPHGLERRGGGGKDGGKGGGKGGGGGCEIPPWLPFPSSVVSSACNKIVTRKTEILSSTTTSTVPLTTTTTTTTTTTLPQITDTVTSTATSTDVITVTDSTTTFTTTATTTTATATAVSTQCAQFANIDGGGVSTSGDLTPHTEIQSPEACCEFCWTGTGCGLWFFFPGFGCFVVTDANGPDPTTQCPTGQGDYVVINASGFDGDVGGAGPCAGALVN